MLPDYFQPDLRLVLVGTAVSEQSAIRGHYYAGPGNSFWTFRHQAGLTPTTLDPTHDATLPQYGIGLHRFGQVHRSISRPRPALRLPRVEKNKIEHHQPGIVALTSKQAGKVCARSAGGAVLNLGLGRLDRRRSSDVRAAIPIRRQPNADDTTTSPNGGDGLAT